MGLLVLTIGRNRDTPRKILQRLQLRATATQQPYRHATRWINRPVATRLHYQIQMENSSRTKARKIELVWDTGATQSIVRDDVPLEDEQPHVGRMFTGTGSHAASHTQGTLRLSSGVELGRVWRILSFSRNLLSVGRICDLGYRVTFDANQGLATDATGRIRFTASRVASGLYVQDVALPPASSAHALLAERKDRFYYHCLFGHPADRTLSKILSKFRISLPKALNGTFQCESCAFGKIKERPFKRRNEYSPVAGGRWHLDTAGPLPMSLDKFKYFVLIIDEATRRIIKTVLLARKGDIQKQLPAIIRESRLQEGVHVYAIRSDGAKEFKSLALLEFLQEQGIRKETTIPHKHCELAERVIQTVKNIARCILYQANLGINLWSHAIRFAATLYNMRPHASLNFLSPDEAFGATQQLHDIRKLPMFGSRAVYAEPDKTKTKGLNPPGKHCIYLGHNALGPVVLDCNTRKSGNLGRTVQVFNGRFLSPEEATSLGIGIDPDNGLYSYLDDDYIPPEEPLLSQSTNNATATPASPVANSVEVAEVSPVARVPPSSSVASTRGTSSRRKRKPVSYEETPEVIDRCFTAEAHLTSSSLDKTAASIRDRTRALLSRLPGPFSPELIDVLSEASTDTEVLQEVIRKLKYRSMRYREVSQECLLTLSIPDVLAFHMDHMPATEPKSFAQAIRHPCWRDAIQREMNSIREKGVYKLAPLPKDRLPLRSTWVFRIKRAEDGSIQKYKARLCIKGFRQVKGMDFHLTFAPVGSRCALRLFLCVVVSRGWSLTHWDVSTAFLHGDLTETIYMLQPEGYKDGSGKVWLLLKGLYGLKQAPRIWFRKISSVLLSLGFIQSTVEKCVFFTDSILVFLYVDDLLISAVSAQAYEWLKTKLFATFSMKDLGFPSQFLGFSISKISKGIAITGEKYINELLAKFNLAKVNPCATPMESGIQLQPTDSDRPRPLEVQRYQELIGGLLYLSTNLRPDITYAVSSLSQFMNCAERKHWKAAKRILRYLSGTKNIGLQYISSDNATAIRIDTSGVASLKQRNRTCCICKKEHPQTELSCLTDADYAASFTRRSRTGYVCKMNSNIIMWRSRLQNVVSLSTCEAELYALVDGGLEMEFIRKLHFELSQLKPFEDHITTKAWKLRCDNQATIKAVQEPGSKVKVTKHIDVRHSWINEKLENKMIDLCYVSTKENVADMFTKPLPKTQFEYLRKKLGLYMGESTVSGSVKNDDDSSIGESLFLYDDPEW